MSQLSKLKWLVFEPQGLLIVSAGILFSIHLFLSPVDMNHFIPKTVYKLSMQSHFSSEGQEVNIHTFLPKESPWQQILTEKYTPTDFSSKEQLLPSGRLLSWSGDETQHQAGFELLLHTKGNQYSLPANAPINTNLAEPLKAYLQASEHVQVQHPEIKALWQSIKPQSQDVRSVLTRIFQYTHEQIESVPFKGTTDALTTSRLKVASCNGKSRLFVALARLNGIPARLVGGIILDSGSKKTSHQWVEVYVQGHWISFGPTNGYFATRPSHFLKLYQGDEALFRHTSNIGFDYLFTISKQTVSPSLYPALLNDSETKINLAPALTELHLSATTVAIILLFPLCTLIITFLRNVVGVKTFGIFMPMLIAATCMYSGLLAGLVGFILVLLIALVFHIWLEKQRILKTARLATVISLISLIFIFMLYLMDSDQKMEFGMLALMPVVIISFVAERIHQVTVEGHWRELLSSSLGSIFTLVLCYFYMDSYLLQSLFSIFPESYLLVLAGLIFIGKWDGIRISELARFKHVDNQQSHNLLGINSRNRNIIYKHNSKPLLRLAADKLASKQALLKQQVVVPKTLATFKHQHHINSFPQQISDLKEFVIKPNNGSQGNGILVIVDKQQQDYITAGGKRFSAPQLQQHIKEILIGSYSQSGEQDCAYIEPLIKQDARINLISAQGLSDIRVILAKGEIISAMLRVPSKASNGKANLHQGAIGVAINQQTGQTSNALHLGKIISHHPDTHAALINVQIPHWPRIREMAKASYQAIPLSYLGVDICLDVTLGPIVLEVNGRAGLEIQNIHQTGFKQELFNAIEGVQA